MIQDRGEGENISDVNFLNLSPNLHTQDTSLFHGCEPLQGSGLNLVIFSFSPADNRYALGLNVWQNRPVCFCAWGSLNTARKLCM